MAGKAGQAAKEALTEWYGHRDFCWTCAGPDGDRCAAGGQLHDRFMAACSAARSSIPSSPVGNTPAEVPLW